MEQASVLGPVAVADSLAGIQIEVEEHLELWMQEQRLVVLVVLQAVVLLESVAVEGQQPVFGEQQVWVAVELVQVWVAVELVQVWAAVELVQVWVAEELEQA